MLEHVGKADVLHCVVGGMDLVVCKAHLAFYDKGAWVASVSGTGMVTASVTTLGEDGGYITVFCNDLLDK